MQKFFFSFLFFVLNININAQDLSYYLPQNINYNKNIPTPKEIINHEVGEWHITHDRLVLYMKTVAKACPERILFQSMGFTTE